MQRAGQSCYYHFDGLGNVTNLTNSSGQAVEAYSYDVFGNPNIVSAIGNRFMFTGREYDAETGLYYYRARAYSPGLGRFLQRDPLGIDDENTYAYCYNDPVNYIDPYGLFSIITRDPVSSGIGLSRMYAQMPTGIGGFPLPNIPQPGANAAPNAKRKEQYNSSQQDTSKGATDSAKKGATKGEKVGNGQKQNPPPKGKRGELRWDGKHKRWVDDAGVYTHDKRPHGKRGGGSHWDFGSWDGETLEWSPDGINWYPKER